MQTDVLIVGGGLSGLALADHLTRTGTDMLLVEAQSRLGGRILTANVDGAQFDLGPAWFWPGQPRMAALAQRFDIPVFEQYADGDLMYQTRNGATQRGLGFGSMQGSYRLAGGMGSLITALQATIDPTQVMNQTRLTKIEHNDAAPATSIVAHLLRGDTPITIEAQHIVLALPPRVVADTVLFDPPLAPVQHQGLRNIPTWMAGQAKIVAVYDAPHWRNSGLSGDAMSQRGPMVEIHDASPIKGGPYALFGFVGVPADARAAHKDKMLSMALDQLVMLFGPEMAHPRDLILQDWATHPYIARDLDQAPVRQHPTYGLPNEVACLATHGIHFGATETAIEFGGFLEGALEAADATASAIARRVPGPKGSGSAGQITSERA